MRENTSKRDIATSELGMDMATCTLAVAERSVRVQL